MTRKIPVLASCTAAVVLLVGTTGCASLNPFADRPARYDAAQARDQYRAMLSQQAAAPASREPHASAREKLDTGGRYERRGDLQRAVLAYFEAARLEPDSSEPQLRLAHVELRVNPERAEHSFRALVEREDPPSARSWYGLGLAHLAQGELEAARVALEQSLALRPELVRARVALGVVFDRMGDHAGAQAELSRALEHDPVHLVALNNLAVSYLAAGEWARAEDVLRRAARLEPGHAVTHNHLGIAVGLQGRFDEALALFRAVGDEQQARNNLAFVYHLAGRSEEARETYEQALLAGGPDTLAVLRNLERVHPAEHPVR